MKKESDGYDNFVKDDDDVEGKSIEEPKPKYPFSVFFIIGNEFCERFCFYGMRSILTLYLVNILFYSKADATVIYHAFTMMAYFFPLVGAIISDSWLGKFRTIFYVSMIYAAGSIILSLASITPLNLPMREFSIIGLILISIGTGGIKPCVSAFGGDQFVLPQQAKLLAMFFSIFYFSINAGSLLSTFLTPVLREDVQCFGNTSCYPLAFGVPGILMLVSIVIFGLGRPLYKIKKPEGNVVLKVTKCIGHAIKRKCTSKSKNEEEKFEHWLDYSNDKYGKIFVSDIKATLRVLVLYGPLPIFWALYDQQGTAWTFQAVRMDGNIGFYTILPDQFQVVNPLLIMLFIPIFQSIVYPMFQKIGLLRTPLEKMTWGGLLAALAFIVSAMVSLKIEATDPVLPNDGFAEIRFYNPLKCDIKIIETEPCSLKEDLNGIIPSMTYFEIPDVKLKNSETRKIKFNYEADCFKDSQKAEFEIENMGTHLVYFDDHDGDSLHCIHDDITKDDDSGSPFLRTIINKSYKTDPIKISLLDSANGLTAINNSFTDRLKLVNGKFKVLVMPDISENSTSSNNTSLNGNEIEIELKLGGVYTLIMNLDDQNSITNNKLITVTEPNSVSMLWLLPQYFIITAAEILFSITGLEFSYSQAPVSMKSVLTAAFLLTDSIGNLIVVGIESAKIFDKASYDFFLYTGLMIVDMLVFSYLAGKYKYVNFEESDEQMRLDNENNVLQIKNENGDGVENPVFTKGHDT